MWRPVLRGGGGNAAITRGAADAAACGDVNGLVMGIVCCDGEQKMWTELDPEQHKRLGWMVVPGTHTPHQAISRPSEISTIPLVTWQSLSIAYAQILC